MREKAKRRGSGKGVGTTNGRQVAGGGGERGGVLGVAGLKLVLPPPCKTNDDAHAVDQRMLCSAGK